MLNTKNSREEKKNRLYDLKSKVIKAKTEKEQTSGSELNKKLQLATIPGFPLLATDVLEFNHIKSLQDLIDTNVNTLVDRDGDPIGEHLASYLSWAKRFYDMRCFDTPVGGKTKKIKSNK